MRVSTAVRATARRETDLLGLLERSHVHRLVLAHVLSQPGLVVDTRVDLLLDLRQLTLGGYRRQRRPATRSTAPLTLIFCTASCRARRSSPMLPRAASAA